MKHGLGAVAVALALAWAAPAYAGVPLAAGARGDNLPTLAPLLKKVARGVVNVAINWASIAEDEEYSPVHKEFRNFFHIPDSPKQGEVLAAGSGVVINAEKGLIITNSHIVEHANEIVIRLSNGRRLPAKLVSSDGAADVAILEVPAERLTAIVLGKSDILEAGDFVVAIADPFGTGRVVTSGIVGSLDYHALENQRPAKFIQTDAFMNARYSGGALVNLRGELVGLNTVIITGNNDSVEGGVAIPIDAVRKVIEQYAK